MTATRTIRDDIRVTYGWGPWIDWAGRTKKCPLPAGTLHQIRFRAGLTRTDDSPETWHWKHDGSQEDIVAYRIRKVR